MTDGNKTKDVHNRNPFKKKNYLFIQKNNDPENYSCNLTKSISALSRAHVCETCRLFPVFSQKVFFVIFKYFVPEKNFLPLCLVQLGLLKMLNTPQYEKHNQGERRVICVRMMKKGYFLKNLNKSG